MKPRKSIANLGDYPGDAITWRVIFASGCLVAREVGNPHREIVQPVSEWLAERAGFTGATGDLLAPKPVTANAAGEAAP